MQIKQEENSHKFVSVVLYNQQGERINSSEHNFETANENISLHLGK